MIGRVCNRWVRVRLASFADEKVCWFEVAVHDAVGVAVVEAGEQHDHVALGLALGKRACKGQMATHSVQ